jgi:hypothetical protein
MSLDLLPGLAGLANRLTAPSVALTATVPSAALTAGGGEPDPDTIKMFVGQVPRTMTEQELVNFFQVTSPDLQSCDTDICLERSFHIFTYTYIHTPLTISVLIRDNIFIVMGFNLTNIRSLEHEEISVKGTVQRDLPGAETGVN